MIMDREGQGVGVRTAIKTGVCGRGEGRVTRDDQTGRGRVYG